MKLTDEQVKKVRAITSRKPRLYICHQCGASPDFGQAEEVLLHVAEHIPMQLPAIMVTCDSCKMIRFFSSSLVE